MKNDSLIAIAGSVYLILGARVRVRVRVRVNQLVIL